MPRLSVLLLASTLLGGSAFGAMAQATDPPPAPAAAQPSPETPDPRAARVAADHAAFFEARLAALHAGLTLTPEQERMWPPVEQAIRAFVKVRADLKDRRSDAMQDRQDGDDEEGDYIAALRTYADRQAERANALKAVADAATPLYAALTEEQRHRVPMLLHAMSPRRDMGDRMDNAMEEDMRGREHRGRRHGWSDDVNPHRGGPYGGKGGRPDAEPEEDDIDR